MAHTSDEHTYSDSTESKVRLSSEHIAGTMGEKGREKNIMVNVIHICYYHF